MVTGRQLIDELAAAREALVEAIRAVPPERAGEVFLGEWCLLDLMAHLQGWDATNQAAIEEILAGEYPGFFQYFDSNWRSYNQRLVAQYRQADFKGQMAEMEASHRRLVAFLETLPEDMLAKGKARRPNGRSVTIRNLLHAEAQDELEHASQVRKGFSHR
jgi:hypothetical protein